MTPGGDSLDFLERFGASKISKNLSKRAFQDVCLGCGPPSEDSSGK